MAPLFSDIMPFSFRLFLATTSISQTGAFLSFSSSTCSTSCMGSSYAAAKGTAAAAAAAARLTRRRAITEDDREAVRDAIALAQRGYGATFPNPAVGCVILGGGEEDDGDSQDGQLKRGAGWHPRAGFPHAEIYALADYTGRLPEALRPTKQGASEESVGAADEELLKAYLEQGPAMFAGAATGATAYVTLEPCSHKGKRTPPCAQTLAAAGVSRVVVAAVDPNPSVDGGGVAVLREAGVTVDVLRPQDAQKEFRAAEALIADFSERMRRQAAADANAAANAAAAADDADGDGPAQAFATPSDALAETGAGRSALRRIANQRQAAKTLTQLQLGGAALVNDDHDDDDDDDDDTAAVETGREPASFEFDPAWMSEADRMLRTGELLLLRMAKSKQGMKKSAAKARGAAVAAQLGAHIAQVKGHTVLLYRPSLAQPSIDLVALLGEGN